MKQHPAYTDYPQMDLFVRNGGLNAPPAVVEEMRRALEEIDYLREQLAWNEQIY